MQRTDVDPGMASGLVVAAAALLGGCATSTPLPEHTLLLAAVAAVPAQADVLQGMEIEGDKLPSVKWDTACIDETADISASNYVAVRFHYYWHNASVIHGRYAWVEVPDQTSVAVGSVVEVELVRAPNAPDGRFGLLRSVLFEDLKSAKCEFLRPARGGAKQVADAINPIGGSGSASLDCPGLAAQGWTEIPFGPCGATVWSRDPPPLP